MDAQRIEVLVSYLIGADPDSTGVVDALRGDFADSGWHISLDSNPYADASTYRNLYTAEMGNPFRTWLQSQSVGVDEFSTAIGPTQYNSIRLIPKWVFPEGKGNAGWRISLLGFPAVQTIAFGFSHHYGDSTSQRLLGQTSSGLRALALEVLDEDLAAAVQGYRSASAADWDGRGLFKQPQLAVGTLDISSYSEGEGAELRYVRNTTVKKDLACFFLLESADATTFRSDGPGILELLKRAAIALGTNS